VLGVVFFEEGGGGLSCLERGVLGCGGWWGFVGFFGGVFFVLGCVKGGGFDCWGCGCVCGGGVGGVLVGVVGGV